MSRVRPTPEKRRIVDRILAQARRAEEIADQMERAFGLRYGNGMRGQAIKYREWAAVLSKDIDNSRDPRGTIRKRPSYC